MSVRRIADFLFFATFFCVTFEKVHWNVAGTVGIADVLTILFLLAFGLQARTRWPRTSAIVLAFLAAFLLLYFLGFFNLETKQALSQYTKGMVKFVLHFLFLACAVAYLVERGERFYWRTLGWFTAGLGANALYGVLQLLAARAGHNLDSTVLSPLTGGASAINIYGRVSGAVVYRPNALTGDPNHLGIMLAVPLLALTPLYLRMLRGERWKWPLGLTLGFLLLVMISTLSRSGALGLIVGLLVLAIPYRRFAWSRALLVPVAGVALILVYIVHRRQSFFSTVLASRVQTNSESAHFSVYGFIPHVIHTHPLLGLGLNTFSVYYEFVTGKTNWGPAARMGVDRSAHWDDRVELLLSDDAVLLLLRVRSARACAARRVREASAQMSGAERPGDWEGQWLATPDQPEMPDVEARTPRWRAQERIVRARLGGFSGLRVIEVGAGRGANGVLYAERAAQVTLFDISPLPLEQARRLFESRGLAVETVVGDAFGLPEELRNSFDVSMSFGLCEHFLGDRRAAIVAAHVELLRPGGIAFLGVPNRQARALRVACAAGSSADRRSSRLRAASARRERLVALEDHQTTERLQRREWCESALTGENRSQQLQR